MTRGAKPYLVPEQGTLSLGPWQIQSDDEWLPLSDQVEGWDTGTDLRLRREVRVEWGRLQAETGIPEGVPLLVTTSWTSSTTTMRGLAGTAPIPPTGLLLFDTDLLGDQVGGVLDLRTTVVVGADWAAGEGVAGAAGAVLHEDQWRLALEGDGAMFPVSVIDFSHTQHDPDASWHLETSVDVDAPFMGRFLLSLNARDTELVEAVSTKSRTPRQEALLDDLHHGVAQLMLRLAQDVNIEEPLVERVWVPDSIGDVLARTLAASDDLPPTSASEPGDLSNRRTRIEGSTRRSGHGRSFA